MFRTPFPFFATGNEKASPVTINLGAGNVSTAGIVPSGSNGRNIIGVMVEFDADITQTAAQAWKVSDLFAGMRVTKGSSSSNILLNVESYDQLHKVYNALTGLTDVENTYFNNPSVAGAAGSSSNTMKFFIPLQYRTDVTPQMVFTFAPLATIGATSGTVNTTITYYYSMMNLQDDVINILTVPSTLNSGIDVIISTQITDARPINDVYLDVATDGNLAEQSFHIGNLPIYIRLSPFEIRANTTISPNAQAIDGFLRLKTDAGTVYPVAGTSNAKPQILTRFNTALAPTLYLFSKN